MKIKIDRTLPFNPEFIGKSWAIEEEDECSLALTEVDLAKICLENCLEDGEISVKGEEKLKRLKVMRVIRLDAKVFQTFWENKNLIPESWKEEKTNSKTTRIFPTQIFFDGTVLRHPNGRRCIIFLFWEEGRWDWDYRDLMDGWGDRRPSAVLASSTNP